MIDVVVTRVSELMSQPGCRELGGVAWCRAVTLHSVRVHCVSTLQIMHNLQDFVIHNSTVAGAW